MFLKKWVECLVQDVVLRIARNLQVARGEPELDKSVLLEDALRLDVVCQRSRLDAMEGQITECELGNRSQRCTGGTVAVGVLTDPIANVARLERAAYDVVEIYLGRRSDLGRPRSRAGRPGPGRGG